MVDCVAARVCACVYGTVRCGTGGSGCEGGLLRPLPLHPHGPQGRGVQERSGERRARHAGVHTHYLPYEHMHMHMHSDIQYIHYVHTNSWHLADLLCV